MANFSGKSTIKSWLFSSSNSTIAEIEDQEALYHKLNSSYITCSYDKNHRVQPKNYWKHILNCRERYVLSLLKNEMLVEIYDCKYSEGRIAHYTLGPEIMDHGECCSLNPAARSDDLAHILGLQSTINLERTVYNYAGCAYKFNGTVLIRTSLPKKET